MVKLIGRLNKKGNLFDYVEVGIFMLIVVIVGFISYQVLDGFSDNIGAGDYPENYSSFVDSSNMTITRSIDWGALAFLLGALIFSIIMARKIPVEPLFIGIVLFISFVFFIISFIISNVYGGFMDNADIASHMTLNMPITNLILRYFPFVTAIYLAVVLVVFFSKDESGIA